MATTTFTAEQLRTRKPATLADVPTLYDRPADQASAACTLWLQSTGDTCAIKAADLQVGDVTVWNYGGAEIIRALTPKGATQLVAEIIYQDRSSATGYTIAYRVLSKQRNVGVKFAGKTVTTTRRKS